MQPTGYDTWPIVGSSLGLSYSGRADNGPGTFHRVYMNPTAYEAFKKTGQFPEGTTFVLESYEAQEKKSIAQGGYTEGARVGLDASVKDKSRYPDGWAYFNFDNGAAATAKAFPDSRCHSCHLAHGEKDSVFVQFYPNLRVTIGPWAHGSMGRMGRCMSRQTHGPMHLQTHDLIV